MILALALAFSALIPFTNTNSFLPLIALLPLPIAASSIAFSFARLALEILPAAFFGASASNPGALPLHELTARGEGERAVKSCVLHAACALILSFACAPLVLPLFSSFFIPRIVVGVALSALVLYWLSMHRALPTLAIFLASGMLGSFALSLSSEHLAPLLAGLFAVPLLLFSGNSPLPTKSGKATLSLRIVFLGTALGFASVLLPALTPALAGSLALLFAEELGALEAAALSSSLIAARLFFDTTLALSTGIARSGTTALALIGSWEALPLALFSFACAGAVAFLIAPHAARLYAQLRGVQPLVLAGLSLLFIAHGAQAFCVFSLAAAVGSAATLMRVRASACSGSLVLPALVAAFAQG